MTPQEMQKRIEELENWKKSFTTRELSGETGVSTTQTVHLSGFEENIVVPAQPSKTLKLNIKGVVYELLCK